MRPKILYAELKDEDNINLTFHLTKKMYEAKEYKFTYIYPDNNWIYLDSAERTLKKYSTCEETTGFYGF